MRAGISGFSLIPPEAVARGLADLERDLRTGAWAKRYERLLDKDEYDVGLRMVIAER